MNKFKVEMILDFQENLNITKIFEGRKYILEVLPEETDIEKNLGENLTNFDLKQTLDEIKQSVDQLKE